MNSGPWIEARSIHVLCRRRCLQKHDKEMARGVFRFFGEWIAGDGFLQLVCAADDVIGGDPQPFGGLFFQQTFQTAPFCRALSKTRLPLWSSDRTLAKPNSPRRWRRSEMATSLWPPTLIPRRSAMWMDITSPCSSSPRSSHNSPFRQKGPTPAISAQAARRAWRVSCPARSSRP